MISHSSAINQHKIDVARDRCIFIKAISKIGKHGALQFKKRAHCTDQSTIVSKFSNLIHALKEAILPSMQINKKKLKRFGRVKAKRNLAKDFNQVHDVEINVKEDRTSMREENRNENKEASLASIAFSKK